MSVPEVNLNKTPLWGFTAEDHRPAISICSLLKGWFQLHFPALNH